MPWIAGKKEPGKIFRAAVDEITALSSLSAPQMTGNLCRFRQAFAPQVFLRGRVWEVRASRSRKFTALTRPEHLEIFALEEKKSGTPFGCHWELNWSFYQGEIILWAQWKIKSQGKPGQRCLQWTGISAGSHTSPVHFNAFRDHAERRSVQSQSWLTAVSHNTKPDQNCLQELQKTDTMPDYWGINPRQL